MLLISTNRKEKKENLLIILLTGRFMRPTGSLQEEDNVVGFQPKSRSMEFGQGYTDKATGKRNKLGPLSNSGSSNEHPEDSFYRDPISIELAEGAIPGFLIATIVTIAIAPQITGFMMLAGPVAGASISYQFHNLITFLHNRNSKKETSFRTQ